MEALRCLKRRLSDVVYRQLVTDAQAVSATELEAGPGGHSGASSQSSATDLFTPVIGSSDQPLPGPANQTLPATTPVTNPHAARQPAHRADAPEPSRCSAPPDERPNGQMSRSSLRTTQAVQPFVKIARPARPGSRLPRSEADEQPVKSRWYPGDEAGSASADGLDWRHAEAVRLLGDLETVGLLVARAAREIRPPHPDRSRSSSRRDRGPTGS